MQDRDSHAKPIGTVVEAFATDIERGLTGDEAARRLAAFGGNELAERQRPGFLVLIGRQFDNPLVIILLAAATVSLLLGEWIDAIAIVVIVALDASVGVIQEAKAEQALAALKKLAAPLAQVVRDGRTAAVPARELVAGDIVRLEAGNCVPADIRLVEGYNLKIDEASLTGESVPANKNAALVLEGDAPLGDRRNTAFMGTLVTCGRGKGVVTATGMNTQIGLIAQMLEAPRTEPTPLQKKLEHLGKLLGTACLVICAVVFAYGLFRDTRIAGIADLGFAAWFEAERRAIVTLFMTAVSLAIAAVPEGLPAIVTVCLALGMQRMIRHHALIRKLPAVETLGCASVVCTDKTGTLTQNQMTVVRAWAGGRTYRFTGEGYEPRGEILEGEQRIALAGHADLGMLLQGAVACNDAQLEERRTGDAGTRTWAIVGDPTEGAMIVAAAKAGVSPSELERGLPRVREFAFDSDRKRMTTIHRRAIGAVASGLAGAPLVAIVKGAPDVVLERCTSMLAEGRPIGLDETTRHRIVEHNRALADRALRVLAVAYRALDEWQADAGAAAIERDLVFVGLLGMIDPPRPEVAAAIATARAAGLRTVMVTGDYRDTAEAIARAIGLGTPGAIVLSGAEIETMSDAELAAAADRLEICCRVSPQHKTRIVDAFRARGEIVAMTGDGVNDAPALHRADIGVAMGATGTDVARQTADMVLTDDNFASIVAAIEQGRTIYSNIRKFVYFLLACNIGEVLIVFGAMLAGLPMPLKPVQLLWLNLVSDGAPALALGLEKGDADIMKRPPRSPDEPVIDRAMALGIAVVGGADMVAILALFVVGLHRHAGHLEAAQTMAFCALCGSELLRAFTARSEVHSIFRIGVFANRWLLVAVAVSAALVAAAVYVPFVAPFFGTVALSAGDWLVMLPFMLLAPAAMELLKIRLRRQRAAPTPPAGLSSTPLPGRRC